MRLLPVEDLELSDSYCLTFFNSKLYCVHDFSLKFLELERTAQDITFLERQIQHRLTLTLTKT